MGSRLRNRIREFLMFVIQLSILIISFHVITILDKLNTLLLFGLNGYHFLPDMMLYTFLWIRECDSLHPMSDNDGSDTLTNRTYILGPRCWTVATYHIHIHHLHIICWFYHQFIDIYLFHAAIPTRCLSVSSHRLMCSTRKTHRVQYSPTKLCVN